MRHFYKRSNYITLQLFHIYRPYFHTSNHSAKSLPPLSLSLTQLILLITKPRRICNSSLHRCICTKWGVAHLQIWSPKKIARESTVDEQLHNCVYNALALGHQLYADCNVLNPAAGPYGRNSALLLLLFHIRCPSIVYKYILIYTTYIHVS